MTHLDGYVHLPDGWQEPEPLQVTVTLEDVSRADAAATVVADVRLGQGGARAIPFSLSYDSESLDPRTRLALRARGESLGRLVLTSTEHIPVPAGAAGVPFVIPLHAVPERAARSEGSPLLGAWEVSAIYGVVAEPSARGASPTVVFGDASVTGFSGCNTFRSTYTVLGPTLSLGTSTLSLGTLVSTRRACVSGMVQEQRLLAALGDTAGFRVRGPVLTLVDADGKVMVTLTRARDRTTAS